MKTVPPPDPSPPVTLGAWLQQHRRASPSTVADDAASTDHYLDLQLLVGQALGLTRSQVLINNKRKLTACEQARLRPLVEQLHQGEPLAYLTGRKEFWSLSFAVTQDVLIPRPDTELLVEMVLAKLPELPELQQPLKILELGTGSGAISIALAYQCALPSPGLATCEFSATDISPAALAVAQANARTHGVNINFIHSHWLSAISGPVDLIVSNPPYIASNDPHLAALKFEPRAALVAGRHGLDAYREIIGDAPRCLAPGGWLFLEHGYQQDQAVHQLLQQHGFVNIATHQDLAGHPRATQAQRPGS